MALDMEKLKSDHQYKLRSQQEIMDKAKKEERALTKEEQADFDNLETEITNLESQIEAGEETLKRERMVAERMEKLKATQVAQRKTTPIAVTQDPAETDHLYAMNRVDVVPQYSKLRAYPDTVDGRRSAYVAGAWVRAAFMRDTRCQRWCNNAGVEYRALGESQQTAGGALVPDEMWQQIIKLVEDYGVFRRYARPVAMGRDNMTVPRRSGGITPTFAAESGALTESDPTVNQVQLSAQK